MFKWETTGNAVTAGQSGTIYKVRCATDSSKNKFGETLFIKKQFAKGKSLTRFINEVDCHRRAAEFNVAPKIIDFNSEAKAGPYIIMEECSSTLLQLINQQQCMYEYQLAQIRILYSKLNRMGIQHNDANLGNVMLLNGTFHLIDFGMSTSIPGGSNEASFKLLRSRIQRELCALTPRHSEQ